MKIKGVNFNYHDDTVSTYEAVFARGDRRLSRLLLEAHRQGCKLDGWSEHFDPEKWKKAVEISGTDIAFYTARQRSFEETLPWDIIDASISKDFFRKEAEKSLAEITTKDCRWGCAGCGINRRTKCKQGGIYHA